MGDSVQASALYVAWPAAESHAVLHIYYFLVQASNPHFVKESLEGRGLQVHVSRTARSDELSSWQSRPIDSSTMPARTVFTEVIEASPVLSAAHGASSQVQKEKADSLQPQCTLWGHFRVQVL